MRPFLCLALLFALVSCSEPSPAPRAGGGTVPSPDATKRARATEDGGSGKGEGHKGTGGGKGKQGGTAGPGSSSPDASGSDGPDGDSGTSSASGSPPSGARVYPAAGRYVYAQSGWEEFCQGPCDREDLPPQQLLEVSLKDANADRAIVEAEAHQSESRTTRTTMLFTRSSALVTNVYARVTYSGFTVEENYEPDPPVKSLLFPLEVGRSWSGKWDADTSGDYTIQVLDRAAVEVAGEAVDALVVRTQTDFRGEYEGRADVTVWLDPDTRSVVKSTGDVHLKSEFGSYATHFQISLDRGPGYS